MAGVVPILPKFTFVDATGTPLAGGKVYTYQAGTSTPAATYQDSALGTPNTNPVVLDVNGQATMWGPATQAYKFIVKTSSDVLVDTMDNIPVSLSSAALAASSGASLVNWIQSGTGAVARTTQDKLRDVVSVKDFGAKGDGTTDDTAAINNCATVASANGLTVLIPPTSAGYATTDTVTIPVGANLEMTGASIKYNGPKDRPALVLGTYGSQNLRPVYKGISVEQIGTLSWPSTSHVGVRAINVIRGQVDIRYISGFTANYECYSDNAGYAYTRHTIQELLNGKYAMVLRTVGDLANGNFVNENTFISGRYGCNSSSTALGSRYGVLVTWDKVSSYTGQNANRWLFPCFELGVPSSGESLPMLFDGAGGNNRVVEARHESCVGPFARLDGAGRSYVSVSNNEFSVIYEPATATLLSALEEMGGANSNILLTAQIELRYPFTWNSGRIVDLISGYGTNRPYIRGPLFLIDNTAPTPAKFLDNSLIKAFKDEVLIVGNAGIGVVLDTSKIKRFNIQAATRGTNTGRVGIKCFDAAGNVLSVSGPNAPYVLTPENQLSTSTGFGGDVYTSGTDTGATIGNYKAVQFGNDVSYAWIIVKGGTNPLLLRSISIQGFPLLQDASGTPICSGLNVYSGTPGDDFQAMASAKPDTVAQHGVYKLGQTVFNGAAAVGAPAYWTAITNAVGYLNKAWVASTAYSFTGEIVINGSNAYVCTVAGVSASSGGPTGTGTGIVDGTVTWDYLGPKAVFATGPNLA